MQQGLATAVQDVESGENHSPKQHPSDEMLGGIKINPRLLTKLMRLSATNCPENNLSESEFRYQLVVPMLLRPSLLQMFHDVQTLGAHKGHDKMLLALQKVAYWPSIRRDARSHVEACEICALYKAQIRWPTPLRQWEVPEHPNSRVHIDLCGPLDRSSGGHAYILLVVCAFSKYITLIPLKSKTAQEVGQELVNKHIHIFGPPRVLVSDQGTEFVNYVLKAIAHQYGIDRVFIARKHPSSNGQVERYVGITSNMLRTLVRDDVKTWHKKLPGIAYVLNSAYNYSVGDTPFYIMFLRDPYVPLNIFLCINQL